MLIQTEPTPNPATLKFLPGREVMASGTRDFATPEEAQASPLADALFAIGDVTGVFYGADFISVSIGPGAEWNTVKPEIVATLVEHYSAGMPLFRDGADSTASALEAGDADYGNDPADAEIIAQIRELIDTRVRPAVAGDGGDILFRGYRDGDVFLTMQGACSGCPSSTATLKQGVQSLLKHYVPEVTAVHAV